MDGDESSSKDIGKFIKNLDLHIKSLGAAILIVHHSGHGDKERSRG
jgi:RecA-family ATPase